MGGGNLVLSSHNLLVGVARESRGRQTMKIHIGMEGVNKSFIAGIGCKYAQFCIAYIKIIEIEIFTVWQK